MDKEILCKKIRNARALRYITNCYSMDVVENADNLWEKEDSILFSCFDHGVRRLIYYVKSYELLDNLLDLLDSGIYFMEFMTKDPSEYIPYKAVAAGKMMRLANEDCRAIFNGSQILQYRDDSIGKLACAEDAEEINQILWSTFHTEVSHLLSDEELREKIKLGQVSIHRGEKIDAILQTDVRPKKFYINQVVNKTDRKIIHAILLKQLWEYVQNGGRYMYAWVEEKNLSSLKFHRKYDMKPDGMWSIIYCMER